MNTQNTALVIGATGGLGAALVAALQLDTRYTQVLSLSRSHAPTGTPALDYADEATLLASAQWVAQQCHDAPLRTVVVATGTCTPMARGQSAAWHSWMRRICSA